MNAQNEGVGEREGVRGRNGIRPKSVLCNFASYFKDVFTGKHGRNIDQLIIFCSVRAFRDVLGLITSIFYVNLFIYFVSSCLISRIMYSHLGQYLKTPLFRVRVLIRY